MAPHDCHILISEDKEENLVLKRIESASEARFAVMAILASFFFVNIIVSDFLLGPTSAWWFAAGLWTLAALVLNIVGLLIRRAAIILPGLSQLIVFCLAFAISQGARAVGITEPVVNVTFWISVSVAIIAIVWAYAKLVLGHSGHVQ